LYHDVTSKKSQSSLSSLESSDDHLSFPPPPSVTKDLLKIDTTSAYSITDDLHEDINEIPDITRSSRLSQEKFKDDDLIKQIDKRVQLHNQSTINKTILKPPPPPLPIIERKESIRKTNTFTSSSHSMVDAGCGGHFLSRIPALRCFRPSKQHHTQKFHKTSPLPPPPLVVR
jgi:hypothetical protein